jgi:transcriptional regulator with XRE-family HTH domain
MNARRLPYDALVPERPPESATRFSRWLDSLIPAAFESDAALARELGISQSTVMRWRRGKTLPSMPMLYRLARVTGTRPDILLQIAGHEDSAE